MSGLCCWITCCVLCPSVLQAVALAAEVAELFRSVVSLSVKLKATSVPADIANPRQLTELGPFDLSFWVASLFAGSPYQVCACSVLGEWWAS
jgi:hypothetical protein